MQSSEQALLPSEIMGSFLILDSRKSWAFSGYSGLFPQGMLNDFRIAPN